MAASSDNTLQNHQHEIERLLGQCLFKLQFYELSLKEIIANQKLSGPMNELEKIRSERSAKVAGMTLGTLVREFFGSYVVPEGMDPPEISQSNAHDNENCVAIGHHMSFSEAEFLRVKKALEELVLLRNNLVHHFVQDHDLKSIDGCKIAEDALVTHLNLIDQRSKELQKWIMEMNNSRRILREVLRSEAFQSTIIKG